MRRSPSFLREPPASAAGASWTSRPTTRRLGVAMAAVLFLSFSGAFGSGAAPWTERVTYWLLTIGAGSLAGVAATELFERCGWRDGALWRVWSLMTLVVACPTVLAAWGVFELVFEAGRLRPHLLPQFIAPVLAVSAALVGVSLLLGRRVELTHAPAPATSVPDPPAPLVSRFLERLPPALRGADLYAVEAEDHYLRLHTSRGSDLILLRLADAIAELEGLEGARTHRSWWVARGAVEDAELGDHRATLHLKGALKAPVSRTYVRGLREAGWFDTSTDGRNDPAPD